MKRILPLVLVAVLTFVLVWLLLRTANEPSRPMQPRVSPFATSKEDPVKLRVRDPEGFGGVVSRSEAIPAARREAGRGRLRIKAQYPDGSTPENLLVLTIPELASGARTETGYSYDDVPSGSYRITVHGEDIVPIVQRAATITEGSLTELTFQVVRGIHPKGIVLDAEDDQPLAGVRIDFNGQARAVSGPDGRFDVPLLLPRTALDIITLEGDTYDHQTYRGLTVPDPADMRLFLGGGKGVLIGDIVNASGQALPDDALLRLTCPPLYDVRRESPLSGRTSFRLEKLYPGRFRIELHFPSGEFPAVTSEVEIPSWLPDRDPETSVELRIEAGVSLEGKLLGDPKHLRGLRFELRDRRNHVVSIAKVDTDLAFHFSNLRAGSYFPVLTTANADMRMPMIEIEGVNPIHRDLDVARQRWQP